MTAVQIGSYCSDFVIEDPIAIDEGTYYVRIDPTTNKRMYLAVNQSRSFQEVESPIVQPTGVGARTWVANDFKVRLHWDRTLTPIFENSSIIIPQNEIRYSSSVAAPNPDASKTTVRYNTTNGSISLRTSQSAPTSTNFGPISSLDSYSKLTSGTVLTYTPTSVAPEEVEQSQALVYFVHDDDDNGSVITATTQKRYLIINPSTPGTISTIDLFRPEVTEAMVNQTRYRINKKKDLETDAVNYSIDVFRSSVTGTIPNTSSDLTYREIKNFTFVLAGTRATSFEGTKITTADGVTFVAATQIFDKSIADLYGDLSLGLFKLWKDGTDTGLYLGYDCPTPTAGTCSSALSLLVREYYNFLDPTSSCQFRMYNLGGDNEYMILITEPRSSPPRRLMFKPTGSGTLTYTPVTATKEERGWTLERVDDSNHTVRLRWNYPGSPVPDSFTGADVATASYLQVSDSETSVSMTSQASASVFVCIHCSRIDEQTGTCATDTTILIDHDLDYTTPLSPYVPALLGQAPDAPVPIIPLFRIEDQAGQQMVVSDEKGEISFQAGTGDDFFTTQTGIITIQQKNLGVVFIGTMSTSGRYLYAKYTAPSVTFVAATNPNVSDGFGWIPNFSSSIITWYPAGSPAPANPIPLDSRITRLIRNFSARVDPNSYDPNDNTYEVILETIDPSVTFSTVQNPPSGVTIVGTRATFRTQAAAVPGTSPVNCSPGGGPASPVSTSLIIRATTNPGGILDGLTIRVPEAPCPVIQSTSPGPPSVSGTSVTLRNFTVSNMDSSGLVEVTLRAVGSPGSAAPGFVTPTTYSQISSAAGFTVSGLVRNTRYAGPSLLFRNTRSRKQVGFTMAQGFQTPDLPPVPQPSTGTIQTRLLGTIVNVATAGVAAASSPRATIGGNSPVSPLTLPTTVQVNPVTLLEMSPGGLPAGLSLVPALRFTGGNGLNVSISPPSSPAGTRNLVTIAMVFRPTAYGATGGSNGFHTLFASGGGFNTGSLHIFINANGKFIIAFSGASWNNRSITGTGSNTGTDWSPFDIYVNTVNMLIITLNRTTGKATVRHNGQSTTMTADFSGSGVQSIFGPGINTVNIGDWVQNDGGSRRFIGNIAEVLLYDGVALNQFESMTLENYFRTAYPAFGSPVTPMSGPPPPTITISSASASSVTYSTTNTVTSVTGSYTINSNPAVSITSSLPTSGGTFTPTPAITQTSSTQNVSLSLTATGPGGSATATTTFTVAAQTRTFNGSTVSFNSFGTSFVIVPGGGGRNIDGTGAGTIYFIEPINNSQISLSNKTIPAFAVGGVIRFTKGVSSNYFAKITSVISPTLYVIFYDNSGTRLNNINVVFTPGGNASALYDPNATGFN